MVLLLSLVERWHTHADRYSLSIATSSYSCRRWYGTCYHQGPLPRAGFHCLSWRDPDNCHSRSTFFSGSRHPPFWSYVWLPSNSYFTLTFVSCFFRYSTWFPFHDRLPFILRSILVKKSSQRRRGNSKVWTARFSGYPSTFTPCRRDPGRPRQGYSSLLCIPYSSSFSSFFSRL